MAKDVDKKTKKKKKKDDVIGNTVGKGFANWIFGIICIAALVFGGLYLIGGVSLPSDESSSDDNAAEVIPSDPSPEEPEE